MNLSFIPLLNKASTDNIEEQIKNTISRSSKDICRRKLDFSPDKFFLSSDNLYIAAKSSDMHQKVQIFKYHLPNDVLNRIHLPSAVSINEIGHMEIFMENFLFLSENALQANHAYIYHIGTKQVVRFPIEGQAHKIIVNGNKQKIYFNDKNNLKAVEINELFKTSSLFADLEGKTISVVYEHRDAITNFEISKSEKEFLILDSKGLFQLYSLETMQLKDTFALDKKCIRYLILHKSKSIIFELEDKTLSMITYSKKLPFIDHGDNCKTSSENFHEIVKLRTINKKFSSQKTSPPDLDLSENIRLDNSVTFNSSGFQTFTNFYPETELTKIFESQNIKHWSFYDDEDLLLCVDSSGLRFKRIEHSKVDNSEGYIIKSSYEIRWLFFNLQNNWLTFIDYDNTIASCRLNIKEYCILGAFKNIRRPILLVNEPLKLLYVATKQRMRVFDIDKKRLVAKKDLSDLLQRNRIVNLGTCSKGLKLYFSSTDGLIYCIQNDQSVSLDLKSNLKNSESVLKFKVNYDTDEIYSYFPNSNNINILSFRNSNFAIEKKISLAEDYPIVDLCLSLQHKLIFVASNVIVVIKENNEKEIHYLRQHKQCLEMMHLDENLNLLVSSSETEIIIWELPTLKIHSKTDKSISLQSIIGIENGLLMALVNQFICFWNIDDMSKVHQYRSDFEIFSDSAIYSKALNKIFCIGSSEVMLMMDMKMGLEFSSVRLIKNLPKVLDIFFSEKDRELLALTDENICKYSIGLTSITESEKIELYYGEYCDLIIVDALECIVGVRNESVEYWPKSDYSKKKKIYESKYEIYRAVVPTNSKVLLVFDASYTIKRWILDFPDIQLAPEVIPFKNKEPIRSIFEDFENQVLYVGTEFKIYLFDYKKIDSADELHIWRDIGVHSKLIRLLKLCHKSKRLISTDDKILKIWNLQNEKPQFVCSVDCVDTIRLMEISEQFELLITVTNNNNFEIWDLSCMKRFTVSVPKQMARINQIRINETIDRDKLFIVFQNEQDKFNVFFYDIKNLFGLSLCEKLFLRELISTEMTKAEFLSNFRMWKSVYLNSFVLQNFYNIYLLATIYGYTGALKKLFREEKVPFEFSKHQIDCLQYMLNTSNNSEHLKQLLKFMNDCEAYFGINNRFFDKLLSQSQGFAYSFLVKACKQIYAFEDSKLKIPLENNYKHQITIIQASEPKYSKFEHDQLEYDSTLKPTPISIYNFHIQMDFEAFGENSLLFLKCYISSGSDEFILSPYRHIITYKWNKLYPFFWTQAFVYWIFFIFYFLYLMNPSIIGLFVTDILLLTLLSAYELLVIICDYNTYLRDYWNYIDLAIYLSCYLFLIASLCFEEKDLYDVQWNIFMIGSMCLTCIRGFSYFKVFHVSAHLIQMSIRMIQYSVTILFFIGYFVVCFAVMLSKSLVESSYFENLYSFYNLLFGNLPENMQEKSVTFQIIVVLGSLIIPIFLINLLIAKLSSSFNELESRQRVLEFVEKANSILELELVGQKLMSILQKKLAEKNKHKSIVHPSNVLNKNNSQGQRTKALPNIYLAVETSQNFEEEMKSNLNTQIDIMMKQQSGSSRIIQKTLSNMMDRFDRIETEQKFHFENYQKSILTIENQLAMLKTDQEYIRKSQSELMAYLPKVLGSLNQDKKL